jgi:tRNA(adenine34) deaminase
MDALAGLAADSSADLVMWTTLQPCLLCTGGIVAREIRDVRYAASDPGWFGPERLSDLNDFLASPWPERSGPEDGPLATFGALLPLLWFLRTHGEDANIARTHARDDPQLLDHARAHARTASAIAADHASGRDAFTALAG